MVLMTHLPALKSRHRCDAFTLAANFEQQMTVRLQTVIFARCYNFCSTSFGSVFDLLHLAIQCQNLFIQRIKLL